MNWQIIYLLEDPSEWADRLSQSSLESIRRDAESVALEIECGNVGLGDGRRNCYLWYLSSIYCSAFRRLLPHLI